MKHAICATSIALALAVGSPGAHAADITSVAGTGCLDVSADASQHDGRGLNVIVWRQCHGGSNQEWSLESGTLGVSVDGKRYCLDVDLRSKIGNDGQGRNVMAWHECHGNANQRWALAHGRIGALIENKLYCLDVNLADPIDKEKRGYNVIAWPECHDQPNQQWVVK